MAGAGMMPRLQRDHSIKLMLAWGTCCRRRFSLSPVRKGLVLLTGDDMFHRGQRSVPAFSSLVRKFSTIAGVQGLVVYALSSFLVFGFLGPIIRRKCPEGFVLTEWTKQRYGSVTALYLSLLTEAPPLAPTRNVSPTPPFFYRLITLFLYMVAELSALQQIINALTGLDGLPAVMVECAITTIYTCKELPGHSRRTGHQPVSSPGRFPRVFRHGQHPGRHGRGPHRPRSGRRRRRGPGRQSAGPFFGAAGLEPVRLAVDLHLARRNPDERLLRLRFPDAHVRLQDRQRPVHWRRRCHGRRDHHLDARRSRGPSRRVDRRVARRAAAGWEHFVPPPARAASGLGRGVRLGHGRVVEHGAFDGLQSAMVSTGSDDLFRNRPNFRWIRLAVVLVIFPVVAVASKSPDILQIYLISDLVSASPVPVPVVGPSDRFHYWRGFEVVVGGLGGLLTVFIFGTIYLGNAQDGAGLMLLENRLYANDWSAFGMPFYIGELVAVPV